MASSTGAPQGGPISGPPARRRPQNPPRHSGAPSRSSSPGLGGSSGQASSGIDTVVTRLLVSTKTLLEGLTQWSLGNCTDDKISDMYVKLGNDLNAACAAFAREKIFMQELLSVPDELRACLEACLSEDEASPATLERHLPSIKNIIVKLLQGLKSKQAEYKSRPADQRASTVPPVPTNTSPASSSSATVRAASPPPVSAPPAVPSVPSAHRKMSSAGTSGSSASSDTPSAEKSSTDRTSTSSAGTRQSRGPPRSATSHNPLSDSITSSRAASPVGASIPRSRSAGSVQPTGSSSSQQPSLPSFNFEPAPLPKPSASTSASQLGDEPKPRLPSTMGHKQQHSTDKSFETLKNQDNLVRRASKRFSRYTLDKMTGSPGRDEVAAGGGTSPTPSHRRSFRPPPMPGTSRVMPHPNGNGNLAPSGSSSFQPGATSDSWSAHVQDIDSKTSGAAHAARRPSDSWNQHVAHLDANEHSKAGLSPLPETAEMTSPMPAQDGHDPDERDVSTERETTPQPPAATQVYLQLGRETKKASLDSDQMPPTLASLQVLFMDRFSYNAGQEDFPLIYIRDPRLGVEYELEDMSEVREGCLLSLNIEPLDQVKQHIDLALSGITLELKDLKSSMAATRRSMPAPPMGWTPSMAGMSSPTLPQGPSHQRRQSTVIPEAPPKTPTTPSMTDHMSSSLRRYQDEVQSVRRDLAGLRQIYSEYSTDHKNVISTLRGQLDRVKSLATSKVSGSRAFIDAGKTKLDGRSQDLLTSIEGLMDAVENMREDVTARRMRPAPHKMEDLRKQIETSRAELDDVLAYMTTVKPAWKKTWSEELQNVVEEQRFLKHQEELLEEMSEDHKEMAAMFENIDELMKKMAPSPGASGQAKNGPRIGLREYIPPEVDRDHQGLSTVMTEVRSLAVDPDRRLKAIQEAEKARETSKEENKQNEFAKELGGFVESKQLRKTGGAEEVERVRQLKNEDALKSMFASQGQVALPDSPVSSAASRPQSQTTASYHSPATLSPKSMSGGPPASAFEQLWATATAHQSSVGLENLDATTQQHIDRLLSDSLAGDVSPAGYPPGSSTNQESQNFANEAGASAQQGASRLNDHSAYVPLDQSITQQPLTLQQSAFDPLLMQTQMSHQTGAQAPSTSSRGRKRKAPAAAPPPNSPKSRAKKNKSTTSQETEPPSKTAPAPKAAAPAPKKVIPATSALPHIGRVRLAQRTAKGRTRAIERPPLPEWLSLALRSGDEEQKALGYETLHQAGTIDFCEPMADRAEAMQVQLKKARSMLAQETSRAQIEETILRHALNMIMAERKRLDEEEG